MFQYFSGVGILLAKKTLIRVGYLFGLFFKVKKNEVFFFFPFYHLGGAERVHVDIVKASGITPNVIITDISKNDFFKKDFIEYSTLYDCGKWRGYKIGFWVLIGYWASVLNHKGVKKIMGGNSPLFYNMLPYLKKDMIKIDLVHAFGGGIEDYSLPYVQWIDKRIVINRKTMEDFELQYKKYNLNKYLNRIQLIENGVIVPDQYEKKNKGTMNILYVGRNAAEKRVHLIGEIAEKCIMQNLPVKFVLIGDVMDAITPKHRVFCELIGEKKELSKYYEEATMVLITSQREGFPMVLMEAMAYGAIPISTDVGGIKYHIVNGKNGFLISNSFNEDKIIQDMVDKIFYLCQNMMVAEHMSKEAYMYAKKYFSIETFNKKYNELFNESVETKREK